jgi:hypothetical protein
VKKEGMMRKIVAGDVPEPELRSSGERTTPYGALELFDLVVPAGALVAYVPVSVDSYCVVVDHGGKRYYFMVSGTSLTDPDVIKTVPPERCRSLI